MDFDNGISLHATMKRRRELLSQQQVVEPIEMLTPQPTTSTLSQMDSSSSCGMMMRQPQQDFSQSQQLDTCGNSQIQPESSLQSEWSSKEHMSASMEQGLVTKLIHEVGSAGIEIAKAEILMRNRENRAIERQARVAKVELSPEGVPIVSYQRVELPDLKCHLTDCPLKSYVLYPDDGGVSQSDGILVVICTNQESERKQIFFKIAELTGKRFRQKLMRNGIAFHAPDRKANNLAELLIQTLLKDAQKVQVPTRLGWSIQDSRVTYIEEGEMLWKEALSYAEDE